MTLSTVRSITIFTTTIYWSISLSKSLKKKLKQTPKYSITYCMFFYDVDIHCVSSDVIQGFKNG